jgi:hypothetical protein
VTSDALTHPTVPFGRSGMSTRMKSPCRPSARKAIAPYADLPFCIDNAGENSSGDWCTRMDELIAPARTASRPLGHSVSARSSQPTRSFFGVRGAGRVVFGAMLFAATDDDFLAGFGMADLDELAAFVVLDAAPMAGDEARATKPQTTARASGRGERRGKRCLDTVINCR